MSGRAITALLLVLAAGAATAGDVSHGVRRQLRELQKLCDEGLVVPAVCVEKQRALLGLAPAVAGEREPAASVGAAETPPALARDGLASAPVVHDSPLGFRVELPGGWSVVSREELDAGFDVLRERLAADPAAATLIDRLREDGPHRRGEIYAVAADRLQVVPYPSPLPEDPAARMRICSQFGAATLQRTGRTPAVELCSPRTVAGRPALLIERDALLPGLRTVQYWVSTPDGHALSFVTTCRTDDAEGRRRELEGVVERLRWL